MGKIYYITAISGSVSISLLLITLLYAVTCGRYTLAVRPQYSIVPNYISVQIIISSTADMIFGTYKKSRKSSNTSRRRTVAIFLSK